MLLLVLHDIVLATANFYSGNLKDLIQYLKEKGGKDIFVDGGAEVVNALLQLHYICKD